MLQHDEYRRKVVSSSLKLQNKELRIVQNYENSVLKEENSS